MRKLHCGARAHPRLAQEPRTGYGLYAAVAWVESGWRLAMRDEADAPPSVQTIWSAPRLEDIDLSDPLLYAFGDPHAVFSLLRAEAPVFWNREVNGPGFWALTRYEDIERIYRDPQTFSSEHGTILTAHRDKP